jgi:hypothetical protein
MEYNSKEFQLKKGCNEKITMELLNFNCSSDLKEMH